MQGQATEISDQSTEPPSFRRICCQDGAVGEDLRICFEQSDMDSEEMSQLAPCRTNCEVLVVL